MNLVKIDFERCKECLFCINFCPRKILQKGESLNKRGYYPPTVIKIQNCTACGTCARVCPEAAIQVIKDVKRT
ncbi:MAG: 4Fe-4S binding protein [Thermoanaerobacterales bacterium]|jgi:2-oxoglutarate ferredoxin oxidoreductase subunit delta|nr:4Fe-4S binding protein [Thermoanaerobacterales bacterium]